MDSEKKGKKKSTTEIWPGMREIISAFSGRSFEENVKRVEIAKNRIERKRARKEHSQKMEVKREGNAFSIKPKDENNW